jgi:hypothetical protein
MIAARREYHKIHTPSYHQLYPAPSRKLTDVRAPFAVVRVTLFVDGGSADPEKNIALFNVVKKARADGVPKTNIESALQKVRILCYVIRTILVLSLYCRYCFVVLAFSLLFFLER